MYSYKVHLSQVVHVHIQDELYHHEGNIHDLAYPQSNKHLLLEHHLDSRLPLLLFDQLHSSLNQPHAYNLVYLTASVFQKSFNNWPCFLQKQHVIIC